MKLIYSFPKTNNLFTSSGGAAEPAPGVARGDRAPRRGDGGAALARRPAAPRPAPRRAARGPLVDLSFFEFDERILYVQRSKIQGDLFL